MLSESEYRAFARMTGAPLPPTQKQLDAEARRRRRERWRARRTKLALFLRWAVARREWLTDTEIADQLSASALLGSDASREKLEAFADDTDRSAESRAFAKATLAKLKYERAR